MYFGTGLVVQECEAVTTYCVTLVCSCVMRTLLGEVGVHQTVWPCVRINSMGL